MQDVQSNSPFYATGTLTTYDARTSRWGGGVLTRGPVLGQLLDIRGIPSVSECNASKGQPVNQPACTIDGVPNACSLNAGCELVLVVLDVQGIKAGPSPLLRWTVLDPLGRVRFQFLYDPASWWTAGNNGWVFFFISKADQELWGQGTYSFMVEVLANGSAQAQQLVLLDVQSDKGVLGPLILTHADAVQTGTTSTAKTLEDVAKQIGDWLHRKVSETGDVLDAIGQSILGEIAPVITDFVAAGSAFASWTETEGKAAISELVDFFHGASDELKREALATLKSATAGLNKAKDATTDALGSAVGLVTTLTSLPTAFWKALGDYFSNTLQPPGAESVVPGKRSTGFHSTGLPIEWEGPEPSAGNKAANAVVLGFAYAGLLFDSESPLRRDLARQLNMLQPNRLPGVGEALHFETHGAFDPNRRPALLDEAPTGEFYELMSSLGVGHVFAEDYWAAHWEVPNVGQAFQMYHRLRPGVVAPELVVGESQLNDLLKDNNLLGLHRERVKAISFDPLARRDLRLLFKAGIITEAELGSALLDLGYSDVNAKRLQALIKKEQEPTDKVATRGDLLAAYDAGVLTEAETYAGLDALGYGKDEVVLIMKVANARKKAVADRLAKTQSVQLARLKKQMLSDLANGTFDEDAANQALTDAGLSAGDANAAIVDAGRQFLANPRKHRQLEISRADILKSFKVGFFTIDTALARLQQLGYSLDDATLIVALAESGKTTPAAPATGAGAA